MCCLRVSVTKTDISSLLDAAELKPPGNLLFLSGTLLVRSLYLRSWCYTSSHSLLYFLKMYFILQRLNTQVVRCTEQLPGRQNRKDLWQGAGLSKARLQLELKISSPCGLAFNMQK